MRERTRSSRARRSRSCRRARLFALLNLAMADGNPATDPDPSSAPLQPTYPIPDHDSGHAVQGGVAAEVLRRFFGTDHASFRTCSLTLPPPNGCSDAAPRLRAYTSFSQAERENMLSRIYIGIHFRRAVETGVDHGRKIGRYTVRHVLRPVRGHDGHDDD